MVAKNQHLYGWRGRIGLVVPTSWVDNVVYEYEQLLPDGVSMAYAPLPISYVAGGGMTKDRFHEALLRLEGAVRTLVEGEVQAVVVGGHPLAAHEGDSGPVMEVVRRVSAVPATTTFDAAVAALRAVHARRIVVASPLKVDEGDALKRPLERAGFTVLHVRTLGFQRGLDVRRVPRFGSYQLVRDAYLAAPEADAVYAPGSALNVVANITALEEDLKRPVVTAVQSVVWWALQAMKIGTPVQGFGRLFDVV